MNRFTSFIHTAYLTESVINSTKFEIDLVKAYNEISEEGKSRAAGEKYQNKTAEDTAKKCVQKLIKQTGKPRLAYRMAGKAPPSVIAPAYLEGGEGKSIKSGEPKTDAVFMSGSKKYRCSIKNGRAAQIASAQTNEIYAVMNATFGKTEGAAIARTISNIIIETGNESVYKATRKKFETKYGEDGFDRLISVVSGLKSGTGIPFDRELQQMNEFLDLLGVREKITMKMSEFMLDSRNRKKLLREFATGENRYLNEDYVASHFLEWFEDGSIEFMDATTFINKTLPNFKFSLRDRGRKSSKYGGGSRGIALRVDFAKKGADAELQDMDESYLGEFAETSLNENYNFYMQTLEEGLGDWLRTAKQDVTKAGMKGYNLIKQGFNKFVDALKKVVSYIASLLSRGIRGLGLGSFLNRMGLQPTEMTYSW
jgi:hypothetical protein